MIVVNLFGGPCTGKSVAAAEIFAALKKAGCNVELVTEYAKDLVWEGRTDVLATDQLFIFSKQARRLSRLRGKVDVAVCDSPLAIGLLYMAPPKDDLLSDLIVRTFKEYDNFNVLLQPMFDYVFVGRTQTESEALTIHQQCIDMMSGRAIKIDLDRSAFKDSFIDTVVEQIMGRVKGGQ